MELRDLPPEERVERVERKSPPPGALAWRSNLSLALVTGVLASCASRKNFFLRLSLNTHGKTSRAIRRAFCFVVNKLRCVRRWYSNSVAKQ